MESIEVFSVVGHGDLIWNVLTVPGVVYTGKIKVKRSAIEVMQERRPREVLISLEHIVAIYRD